MKLVILFLLLGSIAILAYGAGPFRAAQRAPAG